MSPGAGAGAGAVCAEDRTFAGAIASFASDLSLEDIPADVVAKAKLLVLDTLGNCVGSAHSGFADGIRQVAERAGGQGACHVIGGSGRSASWAAFCNGVLAHGQDFDDTHTETLLHPSCVLVPAALASGEANDADGRAVLTALIAGFEAMIAIAAPARRRLNQRGLQTTAVCGSFGAALIGGRLKGHDADRLVHDLGLAGSVMAVGLMECVSTKASAKQLHGGWAAFCGLTAAELCDAGFTGPASVFDGGQGVYAALLHGEDIPPPVIGLAWETLAIRSKLYPCGHPIHAFIDLASDFRSEMPGRVADISGIEAWLPELSHRTVCQPAERKTAPASGYEARFSLPFGIAVMLHRGSADTGDFTDEAVCDEDLRHLMRLTRCYPDAFLQQQDMPARMTITLSDGTRWTRALAEVRGGKREPFEANEIEAKFRRNCSALDGHEIDDLIAAVDAMDRPGKLSGLMRLLDPKGSPRSPA